MRKKLQKILTDELDYSRYEAEITLDDLENLSDPLYGFLEEWVRSRKITDYRVADHSAVSLMEIGYTYPAALITLEWLLSEPEFSVGDMGLTGSHN